jgi:periplasmic divalent cation tolerance protein
MSNPYVVVLTTIHSEKSAEDLAEAVLRARLGACIHLQKIESRYWWKESLSAEVEYLLAIKTRGDLFAELSEFVRSRHPAETPEIVQIPITNGLPAYLDWIQSVTKT